MLSDGQEEGGQEREEERHEKTHETRNALFEVRSFSLSKTSLFSRSSNYCIACVSQAYVQLEHMLMYEKEKFKRGTEVTNFLSCRVGGKESKRILGLEEKTRCKERRRELLSFFFNVICERNPGNHQLSLGLRHPFSFPFSFNTDREY